MNWRILIVDDESAARERLKRIIEEIDPQAQILQSSDGVEAIETLKEKEIDFLFLDVEMPELSGIDVLHMLPSHPFQIVFQTAFSQYAAEAFDLAATDYLLKPYTRTRVEECWRRLLERAKRSKDHSNIKNELTKGKRYLENVIVRMPGRVKIVNVSDVSHFTASSKGATLWSDGLSLSCDQTLAELESSLNPEHFLRIHKSTIISLKCLEKVTTIRPIMALLSDGTELRVAREREKTLRERLRSLSGK